MKVEFPTERYEFGMDEFGMDEFGMNFIPPCFQHKNGLYSECVFSYSKRMKFHQITA